MKIIIMAISKVAWSTKKGGRSMGLTTRILIGLVLGVIAGLGLGESGVKFATT